MADNKDIFGLESTIGGAWSLDGAVIEIEGAEELIVTSIDITYQRLSRKFSPLNQKRKYLAVGEADGVINMGMVIGPHAAIAEFLRKYSDACQNFKSNVLTIQPSGVQEDCQDFEQISFVCTGVLINTLRIGVGQVGGTLTVVTAGLSMRFVSLKIFTGQAAA